MIEISAHTDASKRFVEILDAAERCGDTLTVVRRGRAIAPIAPAHRTSLGEVREFLGEHAWIPSGARPG